MKPINNPETQKFCESVADLYKSGNKELARKMFVEFVETNEPARWEVFAMQDQILYLAQK